MSLINPKIAIDTKRFEELLSDIDEYVAGKATNEVVAEIAAKGRTKFAMSDETEIFNMGKRQYTFRKKGGAQHGVYSRLDTMAGTYVSTTRKDFKGGPFKLHRFGWETKAGQNHPVAKVKYKSSMAYLWEHDTKPYSNNVFGLGVNQRTYVKKGETRKGKRYFFTREYGALMGSVQTAVRKVDRHIQEKLGK